MTVVQCFISYSGLCWFALLSGVMLLFVCTYTFTFQNTKQTCFSFPEFFSWGVFITCSCCHSLLLSFPFCYHETLHPFPLLSSTCSFNPTAAIMGPILWIFSEFWSQLPSNISGDLHPLLITVFNFCLWSTQF